MEYDLLQDVFKKVESFILPKFYGTLTISFPFNSNQMNDSSLFKQGINFQYYCYKVVKQDQSGANVSYKLRRNKYYSSGNRNWMKRFFDKIPMWSVVLRSLALDGVYEIRHFMVIYSESQKWRLVQLSPEDVEHNQNTDSTTGEKLEPEENVRCM